MNDTSTSPSWNSILLGYVQGLGQVSLQKQAASANTPTATAVSPGPTGMQLAGGTTLLLLVAAVVAVVLLRK